MKDGTINIVCGTHALLSKSIEFKDLGLLIVDEEQHFGVGHKERLKELRADVHVLTLTATPIPRTLQLRPDRRARHEPDRHAAGRSPGRAHLHHAVRRRHHPRGAAARAVPRRPDLLCLPAHRGPGRGRGRAARAGAGDAARHGARQDGADHHREHDAGLRRGQVRRAAVDQHRGKRPRYPQRQHDDHPSRRHVWPGAALPAARPRRSRQDARLCLSHRAAGARR